MGEVGLAQKQAAEADEEALELQASNQYMSSGANAIQAAIESSVRLLTDEQMTELERVSDPLEGVDLEALRRSDPDYFTQTVIRR